MTEDKYISLDIHSCKFTDDRTAATYSNRYNYDVHLNDPEDDSDIVIGHGCAFLYLMGKALNEGFDILEVFDENHHEFFYDLMFDGDILSGTEGMKSDWEDILLETLCSNILISDRLEILPEYRGKGYGKQVRAIKRSFFDGCYGVELLHSFPLQLEAFDNQEKDRAPYRYDELEQDTKKARASLNRCYRRDGYKQYKRTNLFYRLAEI